MGFEPTSLRDLVGRSNHRATGDSMCFAATNILSTKERNSPIKNKAIFLHNNLQSHADCDSHKPSTGLFCSNNSNALRRRKEHSLFPSPPPNLFLPYSLYSPDVAYNSHDSICVRVNELGISGWRCDVRRTPQSLAYTKASAAEFCYAILEPTPQLPPDRLNNVKHELTLYQEQLILTSIKNRRYLTGIASTVL